MCHTHTQIHDTEYLLFYIWSGNPALCSRDLQRKLTKIKAWISNYIHSFQWDVIIHLCPPLQLEHGWVITSYSL